MNQDAEVTFEAIDNSESGDGGVEHGALLSRLCEAIYNEDQDQLASIKDQVIELVRRMKNPIPLVEPTLEPPVNEDGSKSYEYAAHVTLTDIAKFQRGSSL